MNYMVSLHFKDFISWVVLEMDHYTVLHFDLRDVQVGVKR
jgi:hypothetical protein